MSRPRSLVSVNDSDPSLDTINALIFGHPGEGKTVFWGTGGRSVLLLDSDNGFQSARAQGSDCYRMPVTDYDELQEAYEYVKEDMRKDLPTVRWVVWDSLTLFQDRALMDDIMVDAIAENPRQDEWVPSRREYLQNMNRVGRYIRRFVDLPINFGISCHVDLEEDHDGSNIFMPQVQGKNMPSKVAGYANVVGYLGKATIKGDDGKDKNVQRLLTKRVGKYYAKDRFDALGKHIDKPTLPKLESLIAEKHKVKTPPPGVRSGKGKRKVSK